jgi:hypothetical protein
MHPFKLSNRASLLLLLSFTHPVNDYSFPVSLMLATARLKA